jgi:hypothetical protein
MSEVTKQQMIGMIYDFALNNPTYRKALLSNPKALLAEQMQQELPDSLTVRVLEEKAAEFFLIAPWVPSEGEELSDDDLEKVAGGKSKRGDSTENQNRYTCNDTKGIGTNVEVELNIGAEEIAKKYFTGGKS